MGWRPSLLLSNTGPLWQAQRKLLHQFLGTSAVPLYHSMLESAAYNFVQRVQPTTEGFMEDFILLVVNWNDHHDR